MPRPRTILTVDWDAFIPTGHGDPQLWDLGHAETKLHRNMMWQLRGYLYNVMKVNQQLAASFWAAMAQRFQRLPTHTIVSDSHTHVYQWLQDVTTVILVDAHHDCWEGPKGAVDCSNWARVWLGKSRTKRIHWIVPDWVDASIYEEWNFVKKDKCVVLYKLSEVLAGSGIITLPGTVDRVHVCRSGCWTPPWCDQEFLDWLKGRECLTFPVSERGTEWDALRLRWGTEEYECMHKATQATREARRSFALTAEPHNG